MNPFRRIQYNSPVVLNFALLSLLALLLGKLTRRSDSDLRSFRSCLVASDLPVPFPRGGALFQIHSL